MKKFNLSLLVVAALTVIGLGGCSSPEDQGTTKADIDQVNKGLPPTGENPPPVPTKEPGAKVGKGG